MLLSWAMMLSLQGRGFGAGTAGNPDYIPGRPWTALIPDPDKYDWNQQSRAGYRYRGMVPDVERFYRYIQEKRAQGQPLSMVENATVRQMQTIRRWPEAPVPNEFWRSYMRYLRDQTTDELNWSQRVMLWEMTARGLVPWDYPVDANGRRAIAYMTSPSYQPRSWIERWLTNGMLYGSCSLGADLTGAEPGVEVFPVAPHNGFQVRYTVTGAIVEPPTDKVNEYGADRRVQGRVLPGVLRLRGTLYYGGCRDVSWNAMVLVKGTERYEPKNIVNADLGYHTQDFDISVPVPKDAWNCGFYIVLGGSTPHRSDVGYTIDIRGSLLRPIQTEDPHAADDAQWRAKVEASLRELGYTDTPAGKELTAMRQALAAGDSGWKAFCNERSRMLAATATPQDAQYWELQKAVAAGGQPWQEYASAHGAPAGAPPSTTTTGGQPQGQGAAGGSSGQPGADFGNLKVGLGNTNGPVQNPGTQFGQAKQLSCSLDYASLPEGSVALVIWARNTVEFTRQQRALTGTGTAWFTISSANPQGFSPGRYTVAVVVSNRLLGRRSFTIGQE